MTIYSKSKSLSLTFLVPEEAVQRHHLESAEEWANALIHRVLLSEELLPQPQAWDDGREDTAYSFPLNLMELAWEVTQYLVTWRKGNMLEI